MPPSATEGVNIVLIYIFWLHTHTHTHTHTCTHQHTTCSSLKKNKYCIFLYLNRSTRNGWPRPAASVIKYGWVSGWTTKTPCLSVRMCKLIGVFWLLLLLSRLQKKVTKMQTSLTYLLIIFFIWNPKRNANKSFSIFVGKISIFLCRVSFFIAFRIGTIRLLATRNNVNVR